MFSNADLPIAADGRIYHLALKPSELAPDVLLVGDPGRADEIAKTHFRTIEARADHRGLVSCTGVAKETGKRVSVVTSGMGTPSLEIVLNELYALTAIDLDSRTPLKSPTPLHVIRIGTSGGLQEETPLGSLIVSEYAIGFDNTGLFYDAQAEDAVLARLETHARQALENATPKDRRFRGVIAPYATKADDQIVSSLCRHGAKSDIPIRKGITISNSGFFANQGRAISAIPLTVPDIDLVVSQMEFGLPNLRVENMEMESSFLFHFLAAVGGRAGAVCVAIANRRKDTFASNWQESIAVATRAALHTLAELRSY